jgi:hypothetical protein
MAAVYMYKLHNIILQRIFCTGTVALYVIQEKRENPHGKPYPLPFGLRNSYRNLKSENSQDYAQKPQRNCIFMTSVSE